MAERKAVNKYYPPDWTPQQGSVNKYVGQHPLRERARKLSQGILVIRFEMPYNIWCGGCGNHIGMGVRYNAEKKKVGNYYTTPIYRFRMKCHLCDNHFEIDTDPKNCDYVIANGARRKEERWEPSATENVQASDKEESKKLSADAMYRLEHGVEDKNKSKAVAPVLEQLKDMKSVWRDDYSANQLLRKKFREEKKELKAAEATDEALKQRGALDLPLLPERLEDVELARKIRYHSEGYEEHRMKRRHEISNKPLFEANRVGAYNKQDVQRDLKHNLLEKRRKMQISKRSAALSKIESDMKKYGVLARHRRKSDPKTDSSEPSPVGSSRVENSDEDASSSEQQSVRSASIGSMASTTTCSSESDSFKLKGCDKETPSAVKTDASASKNSATASFTESSTVCMGRVSDGVSPMIQNSSLYNQDPDTTESKKDLRITKCTHAPTGQADLCSGCHSGTSGNVGGLTHVNVSNSSLAESVGKNRSLSDSSLSLTSHSLVSCEYDDSSDSSV